MGCVPYNQPPLLWRAAEQVSASLHWIGASQPTRQRRAEWRQSPPDAEALAGLEWPCRMPLTWSRAGAVEGQPVVAGRQQRLTS